MTSFIGKRLLIIPFSLFVLLGLSYGLVSLIPGDPARLILGDLTTQEAIDKVHKSLGLDEPFLVRFVNYMTDVLRLDFGTSYFSNRPVIDDIVKYLPGTLQIVIPSLILAMCLGTVIGVFAAYFRDGWLADMSSVVISLIQSIPDFVLALVLIFCFYVAWPIAAAPVGQIDLSMSAPVTITHFSVIDSLITGNFEALSSILAHLVLPVVTLGVVYSAFFAKTVRTTVGEALKSPQVEFARACGLSEFQVIRYALLQARTPILTYGAMLGGALLGGEAIVETVFGWRGLGQWALEGMLRVDVPVIQGFILLAGVATLLIYLVLDIVVARLDPRTSLV